MILYKYVIPERVDILEKGKIRFTQAGSFNDPFDNLPFIDSVIEKNQIDDFIDANVFGAIDEESYGKEYNRVINETSRRFGLTSEMVDQLRNIPPEKALSAAKRLAEPLFKAFLGLSTDDHKIQMQHSIREQFDVCYGVFCLSEMYDNLLMWSHYADCHTGFIIGYDASHEFFDKRRNNKDQINQIKKVKYSEDRPCCPGFSFKEDEEKRIEEMASIFFLSKGSIWQYEKEWRIVRELKEADEDIKLGNEMIYLFKYPPEAIVSVILGCKRSNELKCKITKLIANQSCFSHVELYQAGIDMKHYQLNFDKL